MSDVVRERLAAALGTERLEVEPLSGGLLGRAYRVVAEGVDVAVRLPGQHDTRQSAAAERRILEAAAAAGIAPRPARLPADDAIVATEFLASAAPWSPLDARKPENIERLAQQLLKLHALDITLEPLDFTSVAERYAARASEHHALAPVQRRWRDELLVLARAFDAWHVPSVPCHNDLVASNVLDDGALWLVDFEFAVQGDPILDLASIAAFNGFDLDARTRLLAAYYGVAGAPFDAVRFEHAIRLVQSLAYFWTLAEPPCARSAHAVQAFADELAAMLR